MKKIISVVLVLAMVLLAGCGGAGGTEAPTEPVETTPAYTPNPAQATVNNPTTEIPNYALPEGASVAEMRAMAVQAMHDSLTVKWTPIQNFTYKKSGSGDSYNYQFSASSVYGGILYAEGGAGLLQWMEGMDLSNGVLYDMNFANIGKLQGSSCSAAACWGLAAVCPNMTGIYSTHNMLIKNGFIPLGNVTYDEGLGSFKDYTTRRICEDNGEQTVAEGYALAQPGDVVISSGDDTTDVHAMMVISVPEVVRKADGTIDLEASKLHIQDQRFKDYEVPVDGQVVLYRGRTDAEYTFAELFKKVYIAMAPEDFLKEGSYTPATTKLNKEVSNLKDLQSAKIETNFIVASATATITDANGNVLVSNKKLTTAQDINAKTDRLLPVNNVLNNSAMKKALEPGKTYTVSIDVLAASGARLNVIQMEFVYE